VPKLWNDSIDAHRRAVRDATVDAAAALVTEHGLASVTMSKVAARAGIGRATLYKYFPDVDAILTAWHERRIFGHLDQLAEIARDTTEPGDRLEAVLRTYALIQHESHARPGSELVAALHSGAHGVHARRRLHDFIRGLVVDATAAGAVRTDVPAPELAAYCLHALAGAATALSQPAALRLVDVTLAGLRPQ
jgi:AcrR family transcriptional regulator